MMWMLSASRRSRCVSLCIQPPGSGCLPTTVSRSACLACNRICQRLEAIAIFFPALYRRLVDRLAHLGDAGCFHRPVRFVELKTLVVPVEAEEFDQRLGFLLRVGDDILID